MIRPSNRINLALLATIAALAFGFRAPAAPQELEQTLIQHLTWRNIGNANQRGRISAIDAPDTMASRMLSSITSSS